MRAALAALLLAAPLPALANEPPPRWELGLISMGVSQQAYPGSNEQLGRGLVLPYALYRGEWLRADGETAGLRALRTPTLQLDIGVAAAFGGSSREIEARRGMQRLGTLLEFGPRLVWNIGAAPAGGRWRATLPLRAVFDLDDGLAHRGWSLEPELRWEHRTATGWRTALGLGLIAGDRRLGSTFYGVDAAQALPDRPAYAAGAGLIAWRATASFNKELSRDWRLFGFVRADSVAGAANEDSPLVKRRAGASLGLGLSWTWQRSSEPGSD